MRQLSIFQKLLVFLFLGVILFYSWNWLAESDSFYHLKAGELIWQTKSIPHTDVFSYTAYGKPWITHEWLAELVFYGVYAATGFGGLIWFVAALAALTYYFVIRTAIEARANLYFTIIITFLLVYLTFELWVPRPQTLAFLCLALLVYFLERYRRDPRKWTLVGAVLTVWFWANVNASFILGIVILVFYSLAEFMKQRWPLALDVPPQRVRADHLWLATIGSIAISLINPNSYKIFLYSAYIKPVVATLQVMEWKSIIYYLDQPQAVIFSVGIIVVGFFALWWYGVRKESRDFTMLGLLGGISLLPFISIRHVGFWPIIAAPIVASGISDALRGALDKLSFKWIHAALFIIGIFLLVPRAIFLPGEYINAHRVPAQAIDFLEANNISGPIFSLYNEGGYLVWRLWPKEKVFIDGRSEVFVGEPIHDLFTIMGRRSGWEKLIDGKYHINVFLLPYAPPSLARDAAPLSFELGRRGFSLVYWDDAAMILVRDTIKTHDFVKYYGLRVINPFRAPETIPAAEAKAAADEIRSLLTRAPGSRAVEIYGKKFLESHAK